MDGSTFWIPSQDLMEHHGVCTENVGYLWISDISLQCSNCSHLGNHLAKGCKQFLLQGSPARKTCGELESKRSGEFCFKASWRYQKSIKSKDQALGPPCPVKRNWKYNNPNIRTLVETSAWYEVYWLIWFISSSKRSHIQWPFHVFTSECCLEVKLLGVVNFPRSNTGSTAALEQAAYATSKHGQHIQPQQTS